MEFISECAGSWDTAASIVQFERTKNALLSGGEDLASLRTRLAELEATIAEQRRVGRALAARVRREGGYCTPRDQAVLREAEHVFGCEETP